MEFTDLFRRRPSLFFRCLNQVSANGRVGVKKFLLIKKELERQNIRIDNCVFYSYWFTNDALAVALFNRYFAHADVITRTHRVDLYEEECSLPYLPFKKSISRYFKFIAPVSKHGADYLESHFGIQRDKIRLSRLGIINENTSSPEGGQPTGHFYLASCSFVKPVKRVHLIASALKLLGEKHPSMNFIWTHIGDGPRAVVDEIREQISSLPVNAEARLLGYLPVREIMEFYRNNPVDVFINVSSSEGIPVSIMEAQSFGIPAIVTEVGGVSEIVSEENGALLPANPSPESIAEKIELFFDHTIKRDRGRNAGKNWEERYEGGRNYLDFFFKMTEI